MGQAYGMAEASSSTREPASLSALCLNTAAGQGTAAARQEASYSSLPQEALGVCQSCCVIRPQSSASDDPIPTHGPLKLAVA